MVSYEEKITDEKKYTVYILTSPDGKVYIGTTSLRPIVRWARGKNYSSKRIKEAMEKYPWDSWKKEIIATEVPRDEAYRIEKELIAKYKSQDPEYGYNTSSGGEWGGKGCHYQFTEEHRKRISLSHSGERHYAYGKHYTEEHKRKISEAQKGKFVSEETRKKISESRKGKYVHSYEECVALLEERKRLGISQEQMGKLKGLTRNIVCKMEKRAKR